MVQPEHRENGTIYRGSLSLRAIKTIDNFNRTNRGNAADVFSAMDEFRIKRIYPFDLQDTSSVISREDAKAALERI